MNLLEIKEVTHDKYIFREGKHRFELKKAKISYSKKPGDRVKGFIYSDRNGKLKFILGKPKALLGNFAFLTVLDIQNSGVFLDWGIKPDLYVPKSEIMHMPKIGDQIPVFIKMDKKFKQIIGTNLIEEYLVNADANIEPGNSCELLFYFKGRDRFGVIIDQRYRGIIPISDVIGDFSPGDKAKGFIKNIDEDKRITVSLYKNKRHMIQSAEREIIKRLLDSGGTLPFHDKTFPKVINQELHMSKRLFKNAIGTLFKSKTIKIHDNGIELIKY
jgi:predicted RNA-binding protein (virulence factor B family)